MTPTGLNFSPISYRTGNGQSPANFSTDPTARPDGTNLSFATNGSSVPSGYTSGSALTFGTPRTNGMTLSGFYGGGSGSASGGYGTGNYSTSGLGTGFNNNLTTQAGLPGLGTNGAAGNSTPNFTTMSNVKSGPFQTGLNGLADTINSQTFNPNVNPNVTFANTKNSALQGAVNGFIGNLGSYQNPTDFTKSGQLQDNVNSTYGTVNANNAANQGTYNSYLNTFNAQSPQVAANVSSENSAINNIYNGGLQGQLAQNAAQEAKAVNQSGQLALANANRQNSAARLGGGNSSYSNAQALNTEANIYANEALNQAQLGRSNIQYTQGLQNSMVGVQNNNLEGLANRALQPATNLNQLTAQYQSQLGNNANLDLANNIYTTPQQQGQNTASLLNSASSVGNNNNFYTLDNPQSFAGRQSQLLGSGIGANNQNNFYGLSTPYAGNTGGYPSPGGYSGWAQGGSSGGYGGNYGSGGGYGNTSTGLNAADPMNPYSYPNQGQQPSYPQGNNPALAGAYAAAAGVVSGGLPQIPGGYSGQRGAAPYAMSPGIPYTPTQDATGVNTGSFGATDSLGLQNYLGGAANTPYY